MSKSGLSFKYLITILTGVLISCCNTESPHLTINFDKRASMPGKGRSSAVGFAVSGKGYVTLGRNADNVQLNDCWEYDPQLNTWKQKSSFPGIPRVKASAIVLNNKAYIGLGHNNAVGVYNPTSCLKDFWEYKPETDTWRRLADFPSNFTDACISFVYNYAIYIGIGFSESSYGSELWKYIPAEDKWIRLNDFTGRQRFGAVACQNDRHIFFGTGYRTGNLNDWWEYHPESDSWTELESMPDNGRVNSVSLCIDNRIFVATGRHFGGNLTGGHVKSDLMEYGTSIDGWHLRGEIPDGNRENAIAFVIDGRGYIGFGENDNGVLNDFWSFKP